MLVTKNRLAGTVLLAALTCGVVCLTGFSSVQAPPPIDRMFPDGLEYDFGKVDSGTQCKHIFRVVNIFNVPLEITELRSS